MMSSLLTACGTATFSKEATLVLPDVVEYSKEMQNKAADEIESQNVPTLTEFMKDYKVMRDQTRVARKSSWFERLIP
jgi:hypothetical protein